MAVRYRGPNPGAVQPTQNRVLAPSPCVDQTAKISNAGFPTKFFERVRRQAAERGVGHSIDLDRAELLSLAGPEHPALFARGDREIDRIDEPVTHEPGDGEERAVVEELVEELALVRLLAAILESLALAGENDVLSSGHETTWSRGALIGLGGRRTPPLAGFDRRRHVARG